MVRPIIILASCLVGVSVASARGDVAEDWKTFRKNHKFHIQTIAASEPREDGSRTLIVSEPPPHVTLEALVEIDPALRAPEIMVHPIGHDGWVKDVVINLPRTSDIAFRNLVSKMTRYLFFTSYKASVLPIRSPDSPLALTKASAKQPRLDLNVSDTQLRSWLVDKNSRFVPLLGGAGLRLEELMAGATGGVFFSGKPGLVAWVFPKSEDLALRRVEARQFALDSDLILGAIASGRSVAVIGRERVTPCDIMPPLRVETLQLLASVQTDRLAQSYERLNFAAGKFDDKTSADWAPIHLSNELVDTEYGSLLNITDQLLKSWSMKGTIRYENFEYPTPRGWPFPKPILALLETPTSLTFNWNTRGAAYASSNGATTVVALNRTGALPVSYIPDGRGGLTRSLENVRKLQADAYNYFAQQGDPNLARVVQYASLYQVLRRFGVWAKAPDTAQAIPTDPLTRKVAAILREFAELNEESMEQNIKAMHENEVTQLDVLGLISSLSYIAELQALIQEIQGRWGNEGLQELAELLANPRRGAMHRHDVFLRIEAALEQLPPKRRQDAAREIESATKILAHLDKPSGALAGVNAEDRKEFALQSVAGELTEHRAVVRLVTGTSIASLKSEYEKQAKRPEMGWIHTPSIVVSFTKEALLSGGHDLLSEVAEFGEDRSVPRGTVRVATNGDRRVVLFHPADREYPHALKALVSKYGSYLADAPLQDGMNKVLRSAAPLTPVRRARNVALGFTANDQPSANRGLQRVSTESGYPPSGFRTVARTLTPQQAEFLRSFVGTPFNGTVVERRNSASTMIYHEQSGHLIEATDTTGTVDALVQIASASRRAGRYSVFVFREGFTIDEAKSMGEAVRLSADADIILEVKRSNSTELRTLLSDAELKLKDAKIRKVVHINDPIRGLGVELTLEIPSRSSVSSFVYKIRVFLLEVGQSITEFATSVRNTVDAFTSRLTAASDNFSAWYIAREVNRELKAQFGDGVVEVMVHQTKDYVPVEAGHSYEPTG